MSPLDAVASLFSGSNPALNQAQRPGHTHSIMNQGNTSTTQANGTGATQSFASILGGIMGSTKKD